MNLTNDYVLVNMLNNNFESESIVEYTWEQLQ